MGGFINRSGANITGIIGRWLLCAKIEAVKNVTDRLRRTETTSDIQYSDGQGPMGSVICSVSA